MDTLTAFAMGEANRGREMKVFDWDKAARLIAEHKSKYASAGLLEDWEWTGGCIYEDGKPMLDEYTYLASTWATPTLLLDDAYDCYVMESETAWKAETKWPESALRILEEAQK